MSALLLMQNKRYKAKIDEIKIYLSKKLSSPKYRHSLGVASTSLSLAEKHGVSPSKAYLAGLLHDAGRTVDVESYLAYIKKHRINPGQFREFYACNPFLLHGIIGRHIARTRFKVTNRDILDSISGHTVAKISMSMLEIVVYVADMIAPDRRFPWVKELRLKAFKNLNKAFFRAIELKITGVLKRKKQISPETILVWNELLEKNKF